MDEGFLGRECNNPSCKKYFRVFANTVEAELFCPYCGSQFSGSELWTPEQQRYLRRAAEEKAKEYMFGEIDKIFGDFARRTRGNKYVTFKHTPSNYRAKPVIPNYSEKSVDTELVCPECQFRFQVFGIFGYCPKCKTENIKIYDANLAIILREIASSPDPNRALRHAYTDLVSTFEQFCRKKAASLTQETARFQSMKDTRDFFKKHFNKDILNGISEDDHKIIRRVFQKRHLYEHNGGIVNAMYIQNVPEDRKYQGQPAPLTEDEFRAAADILRRMLNNLV
jgi:Zn finger protein HypA/HybF involved in hydrogenase expression